ncbi:MAG TPA: ROK family protein [Lentimicrobium sp.]|nr:ROK family protein [Lentimicrobium sp.]
METPGNNYLKKARLKQHIINRLYKDGQLSIHDLCVSSKMSAPTITKAVDELIFRQLVIRMGIGDSSGGRKPGLFAINPSSRYVMAIDLERSFIKMCVFDFGNNPASKIYQFEEGLDTLPDVFEYINVKVHEVLKNNHISKKKVLGIGLSLPGLIDIHTGMSYTYLTSKKPVAAILTELTGISTFIEHDTKIMAWAEQAFGLAKGLNNVLCLNIGSGVGLSMILNGEIYKGHSGYSGEFGHIQIDRKGDLCQCGHIGCIETLASSKAIISKAQKQLVSETSGILYEKYSQGGDKLSSSMIIEAARQGDNLSFELINKAGEAIGIGIAALIQIFNPELVILGGEMSKASDIFFGPINKNVELHTIERIRKDARIAVSQLGDDARIMGSLALVMNKIFS